MNNFLCGPDTVDETNYVMEQIPVRLNVLVS